MDDIDQLSLCSEAQAELWQPYTPSPPPLSMLQRCLQEVFKLDSFRPSQLKAIQAISSGKDCFVSMATGSGKSLLWQLPALLQTGSTSLTVVICPTKALIMDQMSKLCRIARTSSMEAVCYHTDQPNDLNIFTLWLLQRPNILPHCLLVTPELLREGPIKFRLQEIYKKKSLARFVIDEADKFLDWGQSFRDAYLGLSYLRQDFPGIPLLAMSGSITKASMAASINRLGMLHCVEISESLNRPNLHYEVKEKLPRNVMISEIVNLARSGPGIVYCTYQSETEDIAAKLRHNLIEARAYHTRLAKEELKKVLDMWRNNKVAVVVATTAFGMGIDKKNVRWVVHDTMPSSIEAWFQESGRAGRDGLPAQSIIYFQIDDYHKVKKVIAQPVTNQALASCLKPLHQVTEVLLNPMSCLRRRILHHFGEDYPQEKCGACDYCDFKWNISWSKQDVTVDALNALNLLVQMQGVQAHPHWSEKSLAAAIYGERRKDFKDLGVTGLKGFGCHFALGFGRNATKSQILELLQVLINQKIITEYKSDRPDGKGYNHSQYYIKPGPKARDVLDMRYSVEIPIMTPEQLEENFKTEQEDEIMDDIELVVSEDFQVIQEFNSETGKIVDVIVID